ncbi:MAG: hypothetical protein QOD24_1819, partial [Solirubrobacteraceae bacterium]|nr:hypothetical protein [Solirubrobacteraceae bacterium]
MSARDITIDTLTFEDIVRLAVADLPGASQGEWTVHGPIDPGITLLELFAWQFEQRLFMADQLTEPIVRASLRLLGLPDPAPALSASTVLSVRAKGSAKLLPAGTVFVLEDDPEGRQFALDRKVWVLPVTGVQVAGRLLHDRDELELTLQSDTATAVGEGKLSLLVEVAAAPGVAPAWRSGAVDVDPPAQLRWDAIGPDGATAPVEVKDSTGALRRSGILDLKWPAVWDRRGSGPRRLRATAVSAFYTEAVRILGVHPNAVIARHRVPRSANLSDQLGKDKFLPLPGQFLRVPEAAGLLCDGDGDVVLSITERSGERHDWHGVRTWVGSGPADRVFLVDRTRGELRFGDGRSGRILRPAAAPEASLRYLLGAGRAGNLGVFRAWAQAGGAAIALNPVVAGDGDEPESLETARQRAADALAARDRTVTEQDTRELAETTPGLGLRRAHVSPGFHPAFPCDPVPGALAVTIVPHADRASEPRDWTTAPQPDAGALSTARTRLARARLLGQEICVLAPVYRCVTVDVAVTATAQAGDMSQRIVDVLRRYLDPLVGGSERDGWPFGG